MEKEKQDKKANILKITKQVEEVANVSFKELKDQGVQLKKTKQDVKQIGSHVTDINADLAKIERNRRGACGQCLNMFFCCGCCRRESRPAPIKEEPIVANVRKVESSPAYRAYQETLTPERIEKEWCMRYDPEERWIKQVEIGLDQLLKLAEEMKKSFDEQNELAEQICLAVKSTKNRIQNFKQRMQAIQGIKR